MLKDGEVVRPAVALALVKLLRNLPPRVAGAALPKALQGVANLLRNRLQRIRSWPNLAMVKSLGAAAVLVHANLEGCAGMAPYRVPHLMGAAKCSEKQRRCCECIGTVWLQG